MASSISGRPWLHHAQHKNPGLHPPSQPGWWEEPMAQGHWGRPEEPWRGRGTPPPTHLGGAPSVAEAVAEEEVRGGGEVQQGGKLGCWGQGLGLGLQ